MIEYIREMLCCNGKDATVPSTRTVIKKEQIGALWQKLVDNPKSHSDHPLELIRKVEILTNQNRNADCRSSTDLQMI